MRFVYYKNKLLASLHKDVPVSILLWYVILVISTALSIVMSAFWYSHILYSQVGQQAKTSNSGEYKPLVDVDLLHDIVVHYKL